MLFLHRKSSILLSTAVERRIIIAPAMLTIGLCRLVLGITAPRSLFSPPPTSMVVCVVMS